MNNYDNNEINFFARTNFRNREVPFGIKLDDRRRHMYLIGKTGMGKTTLMENMVIQDIQNGHGVCFIDPHGDSVLKILDFVPPDRINDVVYFNPADLDHPIAFNILEAVESKYKHLVASGLMGVFTKIWANLWSARMEYILNNTILALLDSPGNTMLGIARMYIDKRYRKKIIDGIKDPMVKAFWVDEFANYNEKYRTEAVAPIQNKVGQFLSSAIIRNIVGQPKSTIDLRKIMDDRKIFLVDLSKGKVGEDNAALLGAMIITKLQLAALSRVDVPETERKDFFLYVDEFQNFVTDSFATILSEARKYRLNLTIGHQYIGQLTPDHGNTKVRDAVFGNVGTLVVFRVGAADAEFLETEFDPTYTPTDIVNLPKYSVILKLMINGVASDPFTATTIPINEKHRTGNAEKVIRVSRERYGNNVGEVEERISRWMGAEFHEQSAMVIGGEQAPLPGDETPAIEAAQPQTAIALQREMPWPAAAPTQDIRQESIQPTVEIKKEIVAIKQASSHQPKSRDEGLSASRRSHDNAPRYNQHRGPGKFESRRNGPHAGQRNGPKPGSKPKKHNNPIWDTVASLRTEKLDNMFAGDASAQSQPEPTTAQAEEKAAVVKPGEAVKF